jgi:hypothetical protein
MTVSPTCTPVSAHCRPHRPEIGASIPEWLDRWHYDRFITLATNDPSLAIHSSNKSGLERMRRLLKEWDARVNRKVVGPKWSERPEDRTWGFYFLEKAGSNPHWHGLVQFFPPWPESREKYESEFDEWAPIYWKQLMPSGSVDIQNIADQRGINEYVCKSAGFAVSYENFVVPDEF